MSEDAIKAFEREHGARNMAVSNIQHILRMKRRGVKRVLDFGCGFGHFIEACQLFGLEAHGVDRSTARRLGAGVQIHADLKDVPGSFDAIAMFEVLEHLDDPLTTLKALRARLNVNGIMIIEVPDTSNVTGISDLVSYRKIHPLDHINAFTPESLINIMAKVGLKPIRKIPAFVTTSFKRILKDFSKSMFKASTQRYFA